MKRPGRSCGELLQVNKLAQEVEGILSEAVGDFIAHATVKKNCEFIGTTPDILAPEQLPQLAEKIGKSISFFSGKDVGAMVAEKIKAVAV